MQHFRIKIFDYDRIISYDSVDELKLDYLIVFKYHDKTYLKAIDAIFSDGKDIRLLEEGISFLKKQDTFYEIMIYVYQMTDETYSLYENQLLFIGNHPKANIMLNDEFMDRYHIFIKDQKIISDFNYIYLNGQKYRNDKLNNRDVIEILSLRIIYFREFLYINNAYRYCKMKVFNPDNHKYLKGSPAPDRMISHCLKKNFQIKTMEYHIRLESYHETYQKSNFITSLLQSLIMSFGMVSIAIVNVYIGYRGHREIIEMLPTILMPIIMMISSLSFPVISRHMNIRKDCIEKDKVTQANANLLNNLEKQIIKDYEERHKYYSEMKTDDDEIRNMLHSGRVYYLEEGDDNYLKIAIGTADTDNQLRIVEDNGIDHIRIDELRNKYSLLKDVPIWIDLKRYHYISVEIDEKNYDRCFESILLRLIITHKSLKLALLIDREFFERHLYLRNIPHLYNEGKRHIIFSEDDLKLYDGYLILSLKRIDTEIKDSNHVICFLKDDRYGHRSEMLIKIADDKARIIMSDKVRKFKPSFIRLDFDWVYEELKMYQKARKEDNLITLDGLYADIGYENIYKRQSDNLKAVFGVFDTGRMIVEDIEETGLGPHFLIGGSTGSGKSEFIISLIMSLSLTYSADKLNFTLIDYKGSGLADSLSDNGHLLKHITLSLSNVDRNKLDRAIIALNKECEMREEAFAKLSSIVKRSVMNIKEYHNLYDESYHLPHLPFEIIVIDEFAELKSDRPDFMNDIISIARIGRSLGISLILLTQKPSLAVDDEIWANVKTKIALKVQSPADSKELIGSDEAYYIKRPGEFYMTYKGGLIHGYAPFSRAYKDPRNEAKAMVIDYDGRVLYDRKYKSHSSERQIEKYISLINDYHMSHNIEPSSIYLLPLKKRQIDEIMIKQPYLMTLGEYDDYLNLKQGVLTHNFSLEYVILGYYQTTLERDCFIRLVINFLQYNDTGYDYMLYLSHEKGSLSGIIETVDYNHTDDIKYIFKTIIQNQYKVFIIIDDYEMLVQNEIIKSEFEKLLTYVHLGNIHMVISLRLTSLFPYKYRSVYTKYLLGISLKDDIISIFNHYNPVSENCITMLQDELLVGFVMADIDKLPDGRIKSSEILKKIPEKILFEKGMLGYDVMTREPFYTHEKRILVTGYDYDEILRYQQLLKDSSFFEFRKYQDVTEVFEYESLIWIGSNITSQYLFVLRGVKNLKDNEACYVKGDIQKIIRYA